MREQFSNLVSWTSRGYNFYMLGTDHNAFLSFGKEINLSPTPKALRAP